MKITQFGKFTIWQMNNWANKQFVDFTIWTSMDICIVALAKHWTINMGFFLVSQSFPCPHNLQVFKKTFESDWKMPQTWFSSHLFRVKLSQRLEKSVRVKERHLRLFSTSNFCSFKNTFGVTIPADSLASFLDSNPSIFSLDSVWISSAITRTHKNCAMAAQDGANDYSELFLDVAVLLRCSKSNLILGQS